MSIAEKITRLNTAKNDIATALINKGVNIADEDGIEDFANYINNLTVLADVNIPGIVAIGDSNYISYTTGDGEWKNRKSYSGDNVSYQKACYANGKYTAVGPNGTVCYSLDGTNWTQLPKIPDALGLFGIAYGNGVYVCVGSQNRSYYSYDGENWTPTNLPVNLSNNYGLRDVCYGGNRFMCVGEKCSYYSTDGINWTFIYISDVSSECCWYNIVYGNNKFVTSGKSPTATYYSNISYMGENDTRWSSPSFDYTNYKFTVYCFDGDKFIMQGGDNYNPYIYYSYDGATWTLIGDKLYPHMNDICYHNGLYYTSNNKISSDLITWTSTFGLQNNISYKFTKGMITTKVER